jgi:hypothetical protein
MESWMELLEQTGHGSLGGKVMGVGWSVGLVGWLISSI